VAPGRGTLTAASAPQVLVHHVAEAEDTTVSWTHIAEAGPMPVDDAAEARRDAARNLLGRVFARRIAALVEADAACPLLRASTDHGRWLDLNHTGVEGRARPGHALDALALLLREARRLRQYGPTAEELAAEAAAMAQDLATAVTRADDRRSRDLAEHLLATTARGEVLRSPAQTRDLYTPMLPTLTPSDLVAVIKDALEQPGRDVIEVSGREDLGADGAARVQAVVQQVLAEPVAPPAARAAATWAYATDPAAPVGAATLGQDEAHGLVTAQRPGVAVTVKATHFQPGRVAVALRLAVPPCPDAVMVGLIGRAFLAGGLGHHAADDEERLFAGSGINLGASLEDGSFTLAATTTPDRLDRALDRLRAHLVDPGWRLPAYQRARLAWDEELAASERDPSEVADRLLRQHLLGKDPSRRPVVSADLVASTVDANACRAWLAPLLAQAPLAITVVGDVADAAAARDAALRRFPARPTDTPAKATSVEQGRAALLPGVAWRPGRVDTHVPGTVARAALRVAWPTDDQLDIGLSRRRTLLAACLTDRLREDLRQRLGAAYSPGAYHVPSATRRGEGALIALAQVEPAQATLVEERILALADDLATHGIAGDLAQRMLAPVRKALPEVLRRDDWWLGTILARPDQQALRLGWADTIVTDHAAITPGELSALAKQVFVRERTLVVVATCQP